MSYNCINYIRPEAFNGLTTLHTLLLNNNLIFTIEPNTFKSSTELRWLHLQNNNLMEIDCNVLLEQNKLEVLDLSNNRLVTVNIPRRKNIAELNISNNWIKELPGIRNYFNEMSNLRRADLRKNKWTCWNRMIIDDLRAFKNVLVETMPDDCLKILVEDNGLYRELHKCQRLVNTLKEELDVMKLEKQKITESQDYEIDGLFVRSQVELDV